LDRPAGIQHAVKYGLPERTAMMKLAALKRAARIAMGIDVDHAHRTIAADGAKQRQSYGVITANRERHNASVDQAANIPLDILVRTNEIETAAKRDVAHICDTDVRGGDRTQHVIIGPYSLDVTNGARAEARTGAVRHAQIQRNAEERHIDIRKGGRSILPKRSFQQCRNAAIGGLAAIAFAEDLVRDLAKLGVENVSPRRVPKSGTEFLKA
jgi:hypothetical protein